MAEYVIGTFTNNAAGRDEFVNALENAWNWHHTDFTTVDEWHFYLNENDYLNLYKYSSGTLYFKAFINGVAFSDLCASGMDGNYTVVYRIEKTSNCMILFFNVSSSTPSAPTGNSLFVGLATATNQDNGDAGFILFGTNGTGVNFASSDEVHISTISSYLQTGFYGCTMEVLHSFCSFKSSFLSDGVYFPFYETSNSSSWYNTFENKTLNGKKYRKMGYFYVLDEEAT